MFNVGDRVKHVGKGYNFDYLGVEVVLGTIFHINDVPDRLGVMYDVKFDGDYHTLLCFPDEIERIT